MVLAGCADLATGCSVGFLVRGCDVRDVYAEGGLSVWE